MAQAHHVAPRPRVFVPRDEAMAAFAAAPVLDAERLRADLDSAIDQDPLIKTCPWCK